MYIPVCLHPGEPCTATAWLHLHFVTPCQKMPRTDGYYIYIIYNQSTLFGGSELKLKVIIVIGAFCFGIRPGPTTKSSLAGFFCSKLKKILDAMKECKPSNFRGSIHRRVVFCILNITTKKRPSLVRLYRRCPTMEHTFYEHAMKRLLQIRWS